MNEIEYFLATMDGENFLATMDGENFLATRENKDYQNDNSTMEISPTELRIALTPQSQFLIQNQSAIPHD